MLSGIDVQLSLDIPATDWVFTEPYLYTQGSCRIFRGGGKPNAFFIDRTLSPLLLHSLSILVNLQNHRPHYNFLSLRSAVLTRTTTITAQLADSKLIS